MFRSLYTGVSGLAANMTNLDVIGNNIANSNTVGFKSGRATFHDMLSQTIQGASRPISGGLGGTNPMQIGLGTRVGSIDTYFNQGTFQTTGKKTDLALQGSGFYILNDGVSNVYSRAGVFGFDSRNTFVNPATGLKVQGVMADAAGNIGTGPMTDIVIDPDMVMPAAASTTLEMMGNLDAASDGQGTIVRTGILLAGAGGTDTLTDLTGPGGSPLGLAAGDVITVAGDLGGLPVNAGSYTVSAGSTYQDLVDWLNRSIANTPFAIDFALEPGGSISVTNNTGQDITGLGLVAGGNAAFAGAFRYEPTILAGGSSLAGRARTIADRNDLLTNIYDATGQPLAIDFTNPAASLTISGTVGGVPVTDHSLGLSSGSTVGDLMQELGYTLGVTTEPVTLNSSGQIVVMGETGTENALGNISIRETGRANPVLAGAFGFAQTQAATDPQPASLATTVYDSLGNAHNVTVEFTKLPGLNQWQWTASMDGGENILSGGSGTVTFDQNGTFTGASFADGAGALTFQAPGAADVTLALDFGEPGVLTGLTQFEGGGSLQSQADGYGAGRLIDFNIDQSGTIIGVFSNDTLQALGRIGIARFNNADGLVREGDNTFRMSGNSGTPREMFAGDGTGVSILAGVLENSNVDLAKEFTDLVVAQRAFQANSRVISTADQVLEELVNLIR